MDRRVSRRSRVRSGRSSFRPSTRGAGQRPDVLTRARRAAAGHGACRAGCGRGGGARGRGGPGVADGATRWRAARRGATAATWRGSWSAGRAAGDVDVVGRAATSQLTTRSDRLAEALDLLAGDRARRRRSRSARWSGCAGSSSPRSCAGSTEPRASPMTPPPASSSPTDAPYARPLLGLEQRRRVRRRDARGVPPPPLHAGQRRHRHRRRRRRRRRGRRWTARSATGPARRAARRRRASRRAQRPYDRLRRGPAQRRAVRAAHRPRRRAARPRGLLRAARLNAIVGGAFTSRLNLNLREKHGFTYGVRSGFAFRRAPARSSSRPPSPAT
jgi:hypothetical protein